MTPQSVGVPSARLILGKHSGHHALALRCEELGVRLDRRDLDLIYRRFLALADKIKIVGDHDILELIGKTADGRLSLDMSEGNPADKSHLSPIPIPPPKRDDGGQGSAPFVVMNERESEQQEDYLWGV